MTEPGTTTAEANEGTFEDFAARVLDVLGASCSQATIERLSQRLWRVTVGRARLVVFALAFLAGTAVTLAAIFARVYAGGLLNAPRTGFWVLVGGSFTGVVCSSLLRPSWWRRTPEAAAIWRARERLERSPGDVTALHEYLAFIKAQIGLKA